MGTVSLDDLEEMDRFITERYIGSYSSWRLYKSGVFFYLGIRTHDMGGTDHDYVREISEDMYTVLRDRYIGGHYLRIF